MEPQPAMIFAASGVLHFVVGRYCLYRATKAVGSNLVSPISQLGLLLTLALAFIWLGEKLTIAKGLGVFLLLAAPALIVFARRRSVRVQDQIVANGVTSVQPTNRLSRTEDDFVPKYAEGYFFAAASAIASGVSPILVRLGMPNEGSLSDGIAGGTVAYLAAVVVIAAMLLLPGRAAHIAGVNRRSVIHFSIGGFLSNTSQVFRYMALAIAPVSVVAPIQRSSLVFRLIFARLLNPQHEVFSGPVLLATAFSLCGAILLTVDIVSFLGWMGLVVGQDSPLNWQWP
jgi:uncharacterized membrane protein